MVIFPLAPDQTIAQMWSNGARGGGDAGVLKARLNWQLQTNTAIQISDVHESQNVTIKIKKQPSLEITQLCLLLLTNQLTRHAHPECRQI